MLKKGYRMPGSGKFIGRSSSLPVMEEYHVLIVMDHYLKEKNKFSKESRPIPPVTLDSKSLLNKFFRS